MNANELADIVDHWAYKESAEYLTDAATMLRQQQAEIAALRRHRAWIEETAVKELTDEEIIEQANHLADGWFSDKFEKGIFITEEKLVTLVKAILRKE